MKYSRNRKTYDFGDEKYSPELIRQYENPEYARAAKKYERQAKKRSAYKHGGEPEPIYDDFETMIEAEYCSGRRAGGDGKKRKYRFRKLTVFRNVLIAVLLLAVLGASFFFYMTKGLETERTRSYQFDIGKDAAEDLKDYRNILILGSDARAGESIKYSRTDAIIIMSINKKNGDVRLISVMRDSYMLMDYKSGYPALDKLAHAHAYGGGVNTVSALNRNLDLNIKEYIVFNWKAVADTVDCLGGIEIDVKEDEVAPLNEYGYETAANTGRTFHEITAPGKQILDGAQATTYCRIRKNCGDDEGRTKRYRKILKGVTEKAVSSPWKLKSLSKTISSDIKTNMDRTDLFTAAVRAPFYDIKQGLTWPVNYFSGCLEDGVSYVVPRTLESNVRILHDKAFGVNSYEVSPKCAEISDMIIRGTGIDL